MTSASLGPTFETAPGQSTGMKGFDAEFQNLDPYIRVITERIWKGGRVEDIRQYDSDPCVVETCTSVSTSIEDVVRGTYATMAMFPDRLILVKDVIQSGDEDGGFLSSHRFVFTMTLKGADPLGQATESRIYTPFIAEGMCINNRIVHEWLIRDQSAMALHTGTTPQALAQQLLDEQGESNV